MRCYLNYVRLSDIRRVMPWWHWLADYEFYKANAFSNETCRLFRLCGWTLLLFHL